LSGFIYAYDIKCLKNPMIGSRGVPCGRTDRLGEAVIHFP